jgi:hypothetical protein
MVDQKTHRNTVHGDRLATHRACPVIALMLLHGNGNCVWKQEKSGRSQRNGPEKPAKIYQRFP